MDSGDRYGLRVTGINRFVSVWGSKGASGPKSKVRTSVTKETWYVGLFSYVIARDDSVLVKDDCEAGGGRYDVRV
ncbi:hypothetical protein Hdeb2414_s0004g00139751 [Helianthus debilis subsp. tardiflorus]